MSTDYDTQPVELEPQVNSSDVQSAGARTSTDFSLEAWSKTGSAESNNAIIDPNLSKTLQIAFNDTVNAILNGFAVDGAVDKKPSRADNGAGHSETNKHDVFERMGNSYSSADPSTLARPSRQENDLTAGRSGPHSIDPSIQSRMPHHEIDPALEARSGFHQSDSFSSSRSPQQEHGPAETSHHNDTEWELRIRFPQSENASIDRQEGLSDRDYAEADKESDLSSFGRGMVSNLQEALKNGDATTVQTLLNKLTTDHPEDIQPVLDHLARALQNADAHPDPQAHDLRVAWNQWLDSQGEPRTVLNITRWDNPFETRVSLSSDGISTASRENLKTGQKEEIPVEQGMQRVRPEKESTERPAEDQSRPNEIEDPKRASDSLSDGKEQSEREEPSYRQPSARMMSRDLIRSLEQGKTQEAQHLVQDIAYFLHQHPDQIPSVVEALSGQMNFPAYTGVAASHARISVEQNSTTLSFTVEDNSRPGSSFTLSSNRQENTRNLPFWLSPRTGEK